MQEKIHIRFKNPEGKKRFEDWCERYGVKVTCAISTADCAAAYAMDYDGIFGVYNVSAEDAPLVKLRWIGDLA